MTPNSLPADFVQFLQSGRALSYDPTKIEPGEVGLHMLEELKEGEVWIGTDDPDDPNYEKDGYYAVPAVSLTGRCEAYDPEFILLWLPDQQKFGTWDCDHWILLVFDDADWRAIQQDPAPYLDAQWRNTRSVAATRFQPWHRYALKSGRPF
ncbi:MAG: hypothetical protein U1F61_24595 [Opitutaceae bacterium]